MTMYKSVNGESVECTPEEEAAILADRAAAPPSLASLIAAALASIDADVDAIYAAVLGNRAEEYRLAETEAIAFEGDAYGGTVPASVASWAAAKGWSAQQACDDILATSTAWRAAQAAIRGARLATKEQARTAGSAEVLAAVLTGWSSAVAAIRAQLAL